MPLYFLVAAPVVSPEITCCYERVTIQTYTNLRKTQNIPAGNNQSPWGKKIGPVEIFDVNKPGLYVTLCKYFR